MFANAFTIRVYDGREHLKSKLDERQMKCDQMTSYFKPKCQYSSDYESRGDVFLPERSVFIHDRREHGPQGRQKTRHVGAIFRRQGSTDSPTRHAGLQRWHDCTRLYIQEKTKYVGDHIAVDFSRDQIKVNDVHCPYLADVHCSEEYYHDKTISTLCESVLLHMAGTKSCKLWYRFLILINELKCPTLLRCKAAPHFFNIPISWTFKL